MKAEELRIGNFIMDSDTERIGHVVRLSEKKVSVKLEHSTLWQDIDEFEPIPLSEDVMLKCPICVYDELDGEYRINDTRYSIHKVTNFDGFLLCDGNNVLVEIKYLHQLQNLYYALTGEELEVRI